MDGMFALTGVLLAAACLALAWQWRWRLRLERERVAERQRSRATRRRLVEMLRAYRALADALPDAVVVAERDSQRIAWFNPAATRLVGLRQPRDLGAPLGERLQAWPISRWLAAGRMAEPMADLQSPLDPEVRLSLRLVPYSPDLWLLIVRDVTRLVRLEHMRRAFVANVSHELRTPLTVVHGYLDMLDGSGLDDIGLDAAGQRELAPMLAEMKRQSQRMTQLVEDLLTLSRLESRDALPEDTVAMTPMLSALQREAEALSQGAHTIMVQDTTQADLAGSQHELHSAFSNLVSNAVRYTPAGGRIEIRFARTAEGGAELVVQDTGQGIAPEHLPRLTERV